MGNLSIQIFIANFYYRNQKNANFLGVQIRERGSISARASGLGVGGGQSAVTFKVPCRNVREHV